VASHARLAANKAQKMDGKILLAHLRWWRANEFRETERESKYQPCTMRSFAKG
jgi:hypothetical protein